MYWAKEIVLWQSQVGLWLKFLWMNNWNHDRINILWIKETNDMDKNKRDKIKPARIFSGTESVYADD